MSKEQIRNASDDEQQGGSTGVPSKVSDAQNDDITERYTNDDDQLAEGVRELHPNRNVDKEKPIGGPSYS